MPAPMVPLDAPALVTGAGRGIGQAVALTFARHNRPQVLIARSADQLERLADLIRRITDARVLAVACDVCDHAQLLSAVERARSEIGAIRLLVNNAGLFLDKPVVETSADELRRILEVNTIAPYVLTGALAPGMRDAGGGVVVNIASNAGLNAYVGQSAYCASKHALIGWAKAFALEARAHNIRVHNICPGGVDTEFIAGTPLADRLKGQTMIAPQDIADIVQFLVSRPANLDLPEIVVRRFSR
jgi:3-oxoacyl-[acyl-carrier protein] reductase